MTAHRIRHRHNCKASFDVWDTGYDGTLQCLGTQLDTAQIDLVVQTAAIIQVAVDRGPFVLGRQPAVGVGQGIYLAVQGDLAKGDVVPPQADATFVSDPDFDRTVNGTDGIQSGPVRRGDVEQGAARRLRQPVVLDDPGLGKQEPHVGLLFPAHVLASDLDPADAIRHGCKEIFRAQDHAAQARNDGKRVNLALLQHPPQLRRIKGVRNVALSSGGCNGSDTAQPEGIGDGDADVFTDVRRRLHGGVQTRHRAVEVAAAEHDRLGMAFGAGGKHDLRRVVRIPQREAAGEPFRLGRCERDRFGVRESRMGDSIRTHDGKDPTFFKIVENSVQKTDAVHCGQCINHDCSKLIAVIAFYLGST